MARRRTPATSRPRAATAGHLPRDSDLRRLRELGGRRLHACWRPTRTARTATTAPPRPALTTPPHIPVTATLQCSNCHVNTATSFTTYTMGAWPPSVNASRCDSCHNGSYTSEGTTGALGTASYPNHVATDRPRLRHLPRRVGLGITQLVRRRLHARGDRHQLRELPQRHRGAGLTTPPHIPTGATSVLQLPRQHGDELHDLYDDAFGSVGAMRCDACHNGSYTSEGTKGAHGHGVLSEPCRAGRHATA